MSTQVASILKSSGVLARYNKAPFVALLTVGTILLWKALAHSLSVLLDHFFFGWPDDLGRGGNGSGGLCADLERFQAR